MITKHEIDELLPYLRPDFSELDKYHKTLKNKLHEHLFHPFTQDFIERGENKIYVPLEERRPLITVPIGKQIVETVVSYTFGKGNFPKVAARTTKPDLFGDTENLDVVNSKLGVFVNALITKSFLASVIMRASRLSLALKKCIVYFKYVNGKPKWEVLNWKWVQNEKYDPNDEETLISFDFVTFEEGCDEQDERCIYWRKCSYDQFGEKTYFPVKHEDGKPPKFTRVEKEVQHSFGLCPAVVLCANPEDESLFEGQIDNIFQYSIFESVIVAGMRKNMNPQKIWIGEQPPVASDFIRANDSMWALPEGKFISDAPNPQAYQFAMQQEHRLREIILRGARTVEIPNENYQSGEALKMKIAPELNLVQETRTELGDKSLVDMLTMAIRVTAIMAERESVVLDDSGAEVIEKNVLHLGSDVYVPKTDMVNQIDISLGWGEIFIPTAESKNLDIQTAVMAVKGDSSTGAEPLFSDQSTRNAMSTHFNIVDMTAEQAQIEREKMNRLNNMALTALIEASGKSGNVALLLEFISALNESDVSSQPHEYKSTADYIKLSERLAAVVEKVEDEAEEADDEMESEDPSEPAKPAAKKKRGMTSEAD